MRIDLHLRPLHAVILVAALIFACSAGSAQPLRFAFVAVAGDTNKAVYSQDGLRWTSDALPSAQGWSLVLCGNNTFLTVAYDTDKAAVSCDGIHWTATTLPSAQHWWSACYGNGMFALVSANSVDIALSNDGEHWTAEKLPKADAPGLGCPSIAYGNGLFVVLNGSQYGLVSSDAKSWRKVTLPQGCLPWMQIAYGNHMFVALDGCQTATSANGVDWVLHPLPMHGRWRDIGFGGDTFFTTAFDTDQFARSADGVHWTVSDLPPARLGWCSPTSGNGQYMVLSNPGDSIARSTDGVHWNTSTLPFKAFWHACGN